MPATRSLSVSGRPTRHVRKPLLTALALALLPISAQAQVQVQPQDVTGVYGTFDGFWHSNINIHSTSPVANDRNSLLAFTANGKTYSTGVDDDLLRSKGVVFESGEFAAFAPERIGASGLAAVAQYWGGVEQADGGVVQDLAVFPDLKSFLIDGNNGLDLGSGLFNIARQDLAFPLAIREPSKIDDDEPDIIVTQIGQPSTHDEFRFVDQDGNTVGTPVSVAFGGVLPVGEQAWTFYTAVTRGYDPSSPLNRPGADRSRDLRMLAYKLSDFGIDASNYQQVVAFRHTLGGNSDLAFLAYNLAALGVKHPDLALTASNNAAQPLCSGDSVSFTLTLTNEGLGDASEIVTTVALPLNFTLGNLEASAGSYDAQTRAWSVPALAAGSAAITLTLTGTVGTAGDLQAVATLKETDTRTTNNSATTTAALNSADQCRPALTLNKTASVADSNGNTILGDPGDVVTYTFEVTNTGMVSVSNINVSDPSLPGLVCTAVSLAAGAKATLDCGDTNQYTLKLTDALPDGDATRTNTATASGSAGGVPVVSPPGTTNVTVKPKPQPAITLLKTYKVEDSNRNTIVGDAGDHIEYSFSLENTGNVSFSNVVVADSKLPDLQCQPLATALLPGGKLDLVCSAGTRYEITPADVVSGKVVNQATAKGIWGGDDATTTASDEVQTLLTPNPGLGLSKLADVRDHNNDGVSGSVDDQIHYRFILHNSGETALDSLDLSDQKLAALDCDLPASLAAGSSVELTCRNAVHTITADDVARGYVENSAAASGRWTSSMLEAKATERVITHLSPVAGLNLSKRWTMVDANGNGVDGDAGDRIDFSFVAHNTGTARLRNITVSDSKLPSLSCAPMASLAAGASAEFTCTGASLILSASDQAAGFVDNDATASGTWSDTSAPVEARAQVRVPTQVAPTPVPALTLQMEGSVTDSNGSGVAGDAGDIITYRYRVTNSGNLMLRNVRISDPLLPGLKCEPVPELAPGASAELRCTGNQHTITSAEVTAGVVRNTARADAEAAGQGGPVQAQDVVDVKVQSVKLTLDVTPTLEDGTNNGRTGEVGDLVRFEYTLRNTGTVPLTDLRVSDPRLPNLVCTAPVTELKPGESVKLSCRNNTYTLTAADVQKGELTDTATASGQAGALGAANAEDSKVVSLTPQQPPQVMPIPTLSGWMTALLGLLLAALGARRRG